VIARTWQGVTRAEDADRYADYVRSTGLAGYRSTPGNRGSFLLYRVVGETAEFMVISLWDSLEAIEAFAVDSIDVARFYPEDDEFLIGRDLTANHYVVAAEGSDPDA